MKPIRITEDNAAAIEAALKAENGRAEKHAYTLFVEIKSLAEVAEARLEALWLAKSSHRCGATWTETSGAAVAKSYAKKGFIRNATRITLQRRPSGWYLTSAVAVSIGASGGGKGVLTLSAEQDAEAVRRLRASYVTAP